MENNEYRVTRDERADRADWLAELAAALAEAEKAADLMSREEQWQAEAQALRLRIAQLRAVIEPLKKSILDALDPERIDFRDLFKTGGSRS